MTEVVSRVRNYYNELTAAASKPSKPARAVRKPRNKPAKADNVFIHDEEVMNGVRKFIELTLGIRIANRYSPTVLVSTDADVLKGFRVTITEVKKVWRAALKEEKAKTGWATRQIKLRNEKSPLWERESIGLALILNHLNIAIPPFIKKPLAEVFASLKEKAEKIKSETKKKEQLAFIRKASGTLGVTIPKPKKPPSAKTLKEQMKKDAEAKAKEMADVKRGLRKWVRDWIKCKYLGNHKLATSIKRNIDAEIGKHKLERFQILWQFGNPDDPEQRAKVRKAVGLPPERKKK